MAKNRAATPEGLKPWVEAKKRHRLSQAHIQMARELGMNARKFGKIDNHRQEPWKAPLPDFIEYLYFKKFGKERPDKVRSFKEMASTQAAKKQARKQAKQAKKAARASNDPVYSSEDPAPLPSMPDHVQGANDPAAPGGPLSRVASAP
jgi:hypothetical protein